MTVPIASIDHFDLVKITIENIEILISGQKINDSVIIPLLPQEHFSTSCGQTYLINFTFISFWLSKITKIGIWQLLFTEISQLYLQSCSRVKTICTLLKYMFANIACKKLSATKYWLMTAHSSSHRPELNRWENYDKSASSFLQLFLKTVPLTVDTDMSSLGPLIIWSHCVSYEGVSYRLHAIHHIHGQGRCVNQAGVELCGLLRDVRWGGAGAEARGSHQYRIHLPGERHRVWRPVPVAETWAVDSGTRHNTSWGKLERNYNHYAQLIMF